jgi:hypothetical protein
MKCSQCPSKEASRYPISEKEIRILCNNCVNKSLRKETKEKVNYIRASKLYHV